MNYAIRVYFANKSEKLEIDRRAKLAGKSSSQYMRDMVMREHAVQERLDLLERSKEIIDKQERISRDEPSELILFDEREESNAQDEVLRLQDILSEVDGGK